MSKIKLIARVVHLLICLTTITCAIISVTTAIYDYKAIPKIVTIATYVGGLYSLIYVITDYLIFRFNYMRNK